jgi:CubicO group peptidase (beta-lactamase class C family)
VTGPTTPAQWLAATCRRLRALLLASLILSLAACASLPLSDTLETGLDRLEAELARMEANGLVGQVAVVHAGEVLLLSGYGTMGVDDPRPVTPSAVMPLASLTKPFTASAVLALAADGRLTLDDPVGRHLVGLHSAWEAVPLEHLLTHSAGLPAEIHNRNWDGDPRFEPIDREELIRRVNRFRPDHAPGTGYNYSNVTYNLLASVVERVSGQPWESFLEERLLHPAGITGIGLLEPDWSPNQMVRGRAGGEDRGHYLDRSRLEDGLGYNLRGAGDLLARPRAIIKWFRAIRSGAWLPAPWLERWLQPRVTEADGSGYGYGLHFRDSPWGPVIGHRGGDRVFATDLSWFTEPDIMVYIASANARFEADVLAAHLHALLLGRRR